MAADIDESTQDPGQGQAPTDNAEAGRADVVSEPFHIDNIHRLIELMNDNQLTEIQIRDGDREIRLARTATAPAATATPDAPAVAVPAPQAPAQATEDWPPKKEGVPVTSPMVGTFYSGSSPEAEPYVTVGSHVTRDTVVCLVEAMKVFNEIRAETQGTVLEVLVENGSPVEYGQPLILVDPD